MRTRVLLVMVMLAACRTVAPAARPMANLPRPPSGDWHKDGRLMQAEADHRCHAELPTCAHPVATYTMPPSPCAHQGIACRDTASVFDGRWLCGCSECQADADAKSNEGPVTMQLFRVALSNPGVADWSMPFVPPGREKPLPIGSLGVTADGSKLVLKESFDFEEQHAVPPTPLPMLFVIDVATKAVKVVPVDTSANATGLSRDGKYALLGGFFTGKLMRVDLGTGELLRGLGMTNVHAFFPLPVKDYVLVAASHAAGPKPFEVRRLSDLSLVQKIPMSALFPGLEGVHPPGMRLTLNGRFLATPTYAQNGFPEGAGFDVFEITSK